MHGFTKLAQGFVESFRNPSKSTELKIVLLERNRTIFILLNLKSFGIKMLNSQGSVEYLIIIISRLQTGAVYRR
jgi:vacuolar-type H+-ATPase subunit I/STV1